LQQSALDGLRASGPVGLVGKPLWCTCWQTPRTPLPARPAWLTRWVNLS